MREQWRRLRLLQISSVANVFSSCLLCTKKGRYKFLFWLSGCVWVRIPIFDHQTLVDVTRWTMTPVYPPQSGLKSFDWLKQDWLSRGGDESVSSSLCCRCALIGLCTRGGHRILCSDWLLRGGHRILCSGW